MLGEDMRGDDLRSATGHNTGNTFNNSIRSNTTSVRDINTSGGRAIVANQFNGDVTINETGETEGSSCSRQQARVRRLMLRHQSRDKIANGKKSSPASNSLNVDLAMRGYPTRIRIPFSGCLMARRLETYDITVWSTG